VPEPGECDPKEVQMAQFPAPTEGIVLTHFIVSEDVERSRRERCWESVDASLLPLARTEPEAIRASWLVVRFAKRRFGNDDLDLPRKEGAAV
jgi:hypothetical protein